MSFNSIMGVISTVALFLPVACILVFRLGRHRSFPALLAYFAIAFINNFLGQGYITTSTDTVKYLSLSNNLLDAPLMLLFLTYFSTTAAHARRMIWVILCFIVFEIVVVFLMGHSNRAIAVILGPGLGIVLTYCVQFFVRHTKLAVVNTKAIGRAVISASLLFAYGCFAIIYLIYYIFEAQRVNGVINEQNLADTYLIFFFSTTMSSIILTVGIFIESKRVQKLNELKVTRKELSIIYEGTQTGGSFKTVLLDFDRD